MTSIDTSVDRVENLCNLDPRYFLIACRSFPDLFSSFFRGGGEGGRGEFSTIVRSREFEKVKFRFYLGTI